MLHVLARGLQRERRPGPHGINLDFPLSFWLRDNGGRWHAARPVGWHPADREHSIGLALVPPLPRSTAWVEVLAGGRSGEVRATAAAPLGVPAVTDATERARGSTASPSCEALVPCGTGSAHRPLGSRGAPAAQPSRRRGRTRARRARRGEGPVRRDGARPGSGTPRTCPCWPSARAARPTRSRSAGMTSTRPRRHARAAGRLGRARRAPRAQPRRGPAIGQGLAQGQRHQAEPEQAARRRNDMLSLLALGYGFQVRLTGQVAAGARGPAGGGDGEDQARRWSPRSPPGWRRWPSNGSASTPTRSW